ncbi:MAG: hypothetical protein KC877_02345 [Candidatus Kaiserbacteria bacterium]|nr:hypothetical protein [Candidatus Kaiserbacteria bacterium]MCB9816089.1 hypothetical protein [Candidatus Nomurabacteria bacterium]
MNLIVNSGPTTKTDAGSAACDIHGNTLTAQTPAGTLLDAEVKLPGITGERKEWRRLVVRFYDPNKDALYTQIYSLVPDDMIVE